MKYVRVLDHVCLPLLIADPPPQDHCPNLEVLDLSNITNAIRDIVPVRVERLQAGCPRLRVLRWTNTELRLADTPLKEQVRPLAVLWLGDVRRSFAS